MSPDRRSVGEKVVVKMQIVPLCGTPARIDYVLHPEEGNSAVLLKVIDIVLDGSISQVAVQRSEFYGSLGHGGVAKPIASPHGKIAELSGGALGLPAGTPALGTPR